MTTQTATERVYNFSAGPAVLPEPVLEQIRDEVMSLPGVGSSVMEISHRSAPFKEIISSATQRVIDLYDVPDDYSVCLLQGGATLQNTMVPANLLTDRQQTADIIITGAWGKKTCQDIPFFGQVHVAWDGKTTNYDRLPASDQLDLTNGAAYLHLTSNETIHGVQFRQPPEAGGVPLVVDQSSDFLSRPVDVSQYGLIYACAQKNCGISGLTTVIIRNDLLERSGDRLPRYLDYAQHVAGGSMLNTPPTFAVYVTDLVCRWIQEQIGGLEKMDEQNQLKSTMLYDVIDQSDGFYQGHAVPQDRSVMNVVFRLASPELDAKFVNEAATHGLTALNGHRSVGGIRASVYNAMPIEGVTRLAEFMRDFASQNG